MHWLIVEDALRDRKGHWFEYIGTFARELHALGDEVTVLADRAAEPFLIEQLKVQPVLPASIWHRMGDGAGALKRYLRVPVHAWNCYRVLRKYVSSGGKFDVVFVPTVMVHHLLGWVWLIKRCKPAGTVLLFFPNLPVHLAADGTPSWNSSPTTRLLHWLLARLRPELEARRVILGVETRPMREALATLTGLPVTYFPHPVTPSLELGTWNLELETPSQVTMACYGPARHEKGSDVLMRAVELYLQRFPEGRVRFIFQWMEDFQDANGEWKRLDATLSKDKRVEVVQRYFKDGEYARYLGRTDVMLLPYRRSSYGLRVSRVVIEAMTAGLPVVATCGTTLHEQASEFGSCLGSNDGDAESFVQAIRETELAHEKLRKTAAARRTSAREHFSVRCFRDVLRATFSKPIPAAD